MERTSILFAEQLQALSEKLLLLGGMVEEMIGKSVTALVDRDSGLAASVIASDSTIDNLELEIDSLIMELLARNQPLAGDLRFIATAMKITPDLERIADHAVNICERTLELNEEPPLGAPVDIERMARRVQEMVRGALDAFVQGDAAAARRVIMMDDEVDRAMEQVFRVLLSHMLEDPRTITRSLRTTFVAKYFERIGDQATNISEQVIYMAEARVVKHTQLSADDDAELA